MCAYQNEYIPVNDYHAGTQGMGCHRTGVAAFQWIGTYRPIDAKMEPNKIKQRMIPGSIVVIVSLMASLIHIPGMILLVVLVYSNLSYSYVPGSIYLQHTDCA